MSGLSPENAAVRITPEIEKALENASFEQMKSILHDAEIAQGLVVRDTINPTVFLPTELASAAPKRFAHVVTDTSGKKVVFESEKSEADALRQANEYLQQHQPAAAQETEQARDTKGRFTSGTADEQAETDLAAKADLQLRVMRGEIDMATYLVDSGVLDHAMARKQAQEQQYTQSWADATTAFLNTPAGADWQGGETNMRKMAETLLAMNAVPSVENLTKAYQHMKAHNLVQPNPEVETWKRINSAKTPEELRAALPSYTGMPRTNGLWGR